MASKANLKILSYSIYTNENKLIFYIALKIDAIKLSCSLFKSYGLREASQLKYREIWEKWPMTYQIIQYIWILDFFWKIDAVSIEEMFVNITVFSPILESLTTVNSDICGNSIQWNFHKCSRNQKLRTFCHSYWCLPKVFKLSK